MDELYTLIRDYIKSSINVLPSTYTFEQMYADIRVFIKDSIDPTTIPDVTEEQLQQEVKKFLVMVLNEELAGVNVSDWDNHDLTVQKVNVLLQLAILKATDQLNTDPTVTNCCDSLPFSGLVREGYGDPNVNNTAGKQGDKYTDLNTGNWYLHNGLTYVLLNESSSTIYNNVTESIDLRLSQFIDGFDNLGNYTEFVFKNGPSTPLPPVGGMFVSGVFVPPDTWTDNPVDPIPGENTYVSKSVWKKDVTNQEWVNITGWSNPINFTAKAGTDGIDGVSGLDGNYVEFIYTESEYRPTTPIGGYYNGLEFLNVPAGWYDEPPVTTLPIYMSKGVWKNYGTTSNPNWGQVGGWSLPIRVTGDAGGTVIIDQSGQVTNVQNTLSEYMEYTEEQLASINNKRMFIPSPLDNGYEIGVGFFNSGSSSTSGIIFKADNFMLKAADGSGITPFSVINDTVYANNVTVTGNIIGSNIEGATITGSTLQTAATGQRIKIDSNGLQFLTGLPQGKFGNFKFGLSIKFGSGVLVYVNNPYKKVPIYVASEQNVADIHLYNRLSLPTGGTYEPGDIIVVDERLYIYAPKLGGWRRVALDP